MQVISTDRGRTSIDRRLYLPTSWTDDRGVRKAWAAADERAFGQFKTWRSYAEHVVPPAGQCWRRRSRAAAGRAAPRRAPSGGDAILRDRTAEVRAEPIVGQHEVTEERPELVPLTCPELIRLLRALALPPPARDRDHVLR